MHEIKLITISTFSYVIDLWSTPLWESRHSVYGNCRLLLSRLRVLWFFFAIWSWKIAGMARDIEPTAFDLGSKLGAYDSIRSKTCLHQIPHSFLQTFWLFMLSFTCRSVNFIVKKTVQTHWFHADFCRVKIGIKSMLMLSIFTPKASYRIL